MKIFYHPAYNIDFGLFNFLHPFDGTKFSKIHRGISALAGVDIQAPSGPAGDGILRAFMGELLPRLLESKRYVLGALELPYIPFLPFSTIEKRILNPMRWAVAGTLAAARVACDGSHVWNLSGGYHHASRRAAEGFCIYNDIGIAVQQLTSEGLLKEEEPILIVDIDAHHGNGNAYVFMDERHVKIIDIYNGDIYPQNTVTRERVDVGIPLRSGTGGDEYLQRLHTGLAQITGDYRLAFVVAGTDVLGSDPLGHLSLSIDDCVARDRMVLERLSALSVPAVFLGGGGYSKQSATAVIQSIRQLHHTG